MSAKFKGNPKRVKLAQMRAGIPSVNDVPCNMEAARRLADSCKVPVSYFYLPDPKWHEWIIAGLLYIWRG